jgi:hypothetical protein
MKTVPITVWIVPVILLTVAILAGINGTRLPYTYFTFMRIVIFFAAGCKSTLGPTCVYSTAPPPKPDQPITH